MLSLFDGPVCCQAGINELIFFRSLISSKNKTRPVLLTSRILLVG
jgi:hypothetical protein